MLKLALAVLLIISQASAANTSIRQYTLPDHGTFEIAVPDNWQDQVGHPPNRLPPTIKFKPKTGQSFEILITPIWPMQGKVPPVDAPTVRKEVASAAAEASSQSIEKNLEVLELRGASGIGYYYSATDRAPNPGEYKYMTQGILPVGQLAVTFTILTNDGQSSTVKAGLKALQNAVNKE